MRRESSPCRSHDTFAALAKDMIDIANLDTLILDLGGVLIDVDYQRTADAFHALGFKKFDEQFSKAKQTRLFDEFETGVITPAKFREAVSDLFGGGLKD